ncbi:serine hydrolase [Microbacterium sp.]|uniref:serine hydrolase n=1 Tax=Microbacterium sp. TaxID=51671 RepID=UPI00260A2E29|nr:serine hydrolase [Microbacterium sp.]
MTHTARRIIDLFDEAGATGYLHATEIGVNAHEIDVAADERVVLASVFKVPIAVAFEREVSEGRLSAAEHTVVGSRYRIGGVGTAGFCDDVRASWRDLAHLMLTLSDNAATDVIYHRIGHAPIAAVLDDLALSHTQVVGCCEDILASIGADLQIDWRSPDFDTALGRAEPEDLRNLAVLDPARTSSSTPRDMTRLLDAIWTDRAAPADACARIRDTMSQQVWPHRLAAGFPAGARVAGKTGTLPGVRNEIGVITYPDERAYAVAVFTRSRTLEPHLPEVDRAIGSAARIAIDALRER